jgi:hypothetical protein
MTINIDFDGTCVAHAFPKVGPEIGAVPVLKRLVENGHKLILFTMRDDRKNKKDPKDPTIEDVTGEFLTDAVNWFKSHDIPLFGIQKHPTQHNWTGSPKSYAQMMIDDSSLGCPLTYDDKLSLRPFVDWKKIEKLLENYKMI